MKKYSKRIKDALAQLSYSKVLRVYDLGDCVEAIVERWGDVCTYRVYNDGRIYEK